MPGKVTGVSFNGTHSYDDWGLKLKNVEIDLPEAKTVYVDVPGMNGSLDLTEAQNGGIVYGMRTLRFTFDARDCNYPRWAGLISRVATAIEGNECQIIIDVDSGYYYTGRCHIDTKKTNEVLSEVSIECNCYPYKLDVTSSNEPWKWDTFCFIDGIIRYVPDVKIASTSSWQEITLIGWPYNETLRVISDSNDLKIKYRNTTINIFSGENILYDIDLQEGENKLYFQGTGTVTIVHKGGML